MRRSRRRKRFPGPCGSSRRRSTPAAAARASSRSWARAPRAASASPIRSTRSASMRPRCSARRWSRSRPARRANRSSASTSPTASTSRRNIISRCWSTARPAASPIVASTEGGMDIETVAHDTPEKIRTITIDPATGLMPHHGREVAAALGLSGDLAKQAGKVLAKPLRGVHRHGRVADRDQPAGGDRQGPADGARCQGRLRQQCRVPPPGPRAAARPHRRRPDGDRGVEVRPRLHQARREHRLHGQRRGPRHGDDGHHQAGRRRARQLPRRRRRRLQGKGHRGVQDHPAATRR